jgi:hypothetical protein
MSEKELSEKYDLSVIIIHNILGIKNKYKRIITEIRNERNENIAKLYRRGATCRQIEKMFGLHYYTVIKILREQGKRLSLTKEELRERNAKIMDAIEHGIAKKDIMKKFDVSQENLGMILLKERRRKETNQE